MRPFHLLGLALLCAVAACSDGNGFIKPEPTGTSVTATGRVYTLSGTVPAGLRLIVESAAGRTSGAIAGDGSFSVRATVSGDSVNLIVDAPGFNPGTHPALVRVPMSAATTPLRVVLLPRQWKINGGPYNGRTVDISPEAAFRPPCTTAGDTNCDGFWPVSWSTTARVWARAALPVRVAFDRARSHEPVTAADSTEFWRIVDRMNTDYGTAMFRPATIGEITLMSDNRPENAVVVRIDTTLAGFGAWTNWWWNASGEMNSAVIRPRRATLLRTSSLMTHELLHTQGFKHSCSWSTVMGGYGCGSVTGLSAEDVAYAQLAVAVDVTQRLSGATHSFVAARNGERVLSLGLPAIGTVGRSVSLGALRADSIGEVMGDQASGVPGVLRILR